MRPAPLALLLAVLTVLETGAHAQGEGSESVPTTKEDLGDTGAKPPSAEDLGKAAPPESEPAPADAGSRRKRRRERADAGPDGSSTQAAPAPAASTPKAAPAAATAANAEVLARAQKAQAELRAALLAEPGDARALDALAQAGAVDALLAVEPQLRPLVRLARARSLMLQGRLDEAATALAEARSAADAATGAKGRAIAAEVRFRLAELDEMKAAQKTCGHELGLWRLASFEGKRRVESVKKIAGRYKAAAQLGDRFWARRAAFRTAQIYEAHYRESLKPAKSLRAVRLPSPLSLSRVSTDELLADVVKGPWPAEIARLYASVIGSVDARDPDPVLVEAARKAAAELGRLEAAPGETAENPFLKDEHEGLVRYLRRFERRAADGRWQAMEAAAARKELESALGKGPGSVDFAYALAALAEAHPAPSKEQILAAVQSDDGRARLAGYLAAERAPSAELAPPIVERYLATPADAKKSAFSTLQGALYGEAERALLALKAIAAKDREVAEKLLSDTRLPASERVWLVAEVGDSRLAAGLQSLAWNEDPVVAGRAIVGLYLAQGKNALGYARPQADGLVGCASRAVHAMDTGR